jgi:transposase
MESYSIDLRAKVLAAYDRGKQTKEIAEMFGVSTAWARRVKQRRREHGELAPRPRVGKHHIKIDRTRLAELVRAQPDATLAELRDRLGVECSISAVWHALRQLGLSFKKSPSTPRSRTAPTSRSNVGRGSSGVSASTRAG